MTVKELIDQLNKLDPDAKVVVLDGKNDVETDEVIISSQHDGSIMISWFE